MPEKLERQLAARADKLKLTGARRSAYIYGGMRKAGWVPKKRKCKHGKQRSAK